MNQITHIFPCWDAFVVDNPQSPSFKKRVASRRSNDLITASGGGPPPLYAAMCVVPGMDLVQHEEWMKNCTNKKH